MAQLVSLGRDALDERGIGEDRVSGHEERRAHAMAQERVEHPLDADDRELPAREIMLGLFDPTLVIQDDMASKSKVRHAECVGAGMRGS